MDKDQWQRPEGALIERAIKRSGRSVRNVASEVGISDTRLRHILNGYQPVGRGQKIEIVGPPETLGRIAEALKVSPDDMRAAGRDDVAEFLEAAKLTSKSDRAESGREAPTVVVLGAVSDQDLIDELQRRLNDRLSEGVDLVTDGDFPMPPADTPEPGEAPSRKGRRE